ncbi:hypothetical protein Q9L58_010390, partial [Maublancomyces gigas]
MLHNGKKNNNKNTSSPTNVTSGEPSLSATPSTGSPPNPSFAPPLAPIFTSTLPNRGRSTSKRPHANTSDSPPPTNTMITLVSTMVSFTGVQNEQATTLKNFAKTIADVHNFKLQCSPHIIALMREMNAFQATIKFLADFITVLETAPSSPPPSWQDTTADLSDQIIALTARINALDKAPPRLPPVASKATDKRPKPMAKRVEKLVNTETTKLQTQLVVTWNPTPPHSNTNDAILASVNNALKETGRLFILAHWSLKGNLVLQTAPANKASEAIDYGDTIASCLKNLGCTPTLMRSNATWTGFLVHNIPTSTTAEDVATAIQLNYLSLTICRHPHWLTTEDKKKEKTHFMMVIKLPRQLTLANLVLTSLAISNR